MTEALLSPSHAPYPRPLLAGWLALTTHTAVWLSCARPQGAAMDPSWVKRRPRPPLARYIYIATRDAL